MPELTIAPDAAETLAADADDERFAEYLRKQAERGERISMDITPEQKERMLARVMLPEIREKIESDDDLSEFERGKKLGKLETFKRFLDETESVEWANE